MTVPAMHQRLVAIAAKLELETSERFQFDGHRFDVNQPPWSLPPQEIATPNDRLLHALGLALYYGAYAHDPDSQMVILPSQLDRDDRFVQRLSEANQTTAQWEKGWRLMQRGPNGMLQLAKDGRYRSASFSEAQPVAGLDGHFELPVTSEQRDWMPMFYFAHSETLPNQCEDADNVRVYVNCDAETVCDVLRSVTTRLNLYRVPFRLKCFDHPRLFARTDALVIYVEKRFAGVVVRLLRLLARTGAIELSRGVPLFTRKLADGIALAEDPGEGQSFGQHRSRLLAEALVEANEQGLLHDRRVFDFVSARFAAARINLESPHLNPGSMDGYAV